jgi:hypothetical protein
MANDLRNFMMHLLGESPYAGFDPSPYELDLQGWGSEHPVFDELMEKFRPRTIIEVGTWKGASAVRMARKCKALGLNSTLLCVDTWLGSHPTLWTGFRSHLMLKHGFPQMYYQFLANVTLSGCQDVILPLPMTSLSAAALLKMGLVEADCIYLDSSHEREESYLEINAYFPLLRRGGVLFGDDYSPVFPGLAASVNRYAYENELCLETRGEKWVLVKPAA